MPRFRQPPSDYDMTRALELGYGADSTGHFPSRDYITGRILKTPFHPTFKQTIEQDRSEGYRPFLGKDGKVYTISPSDIPKQGPFAPRFRNGGVVKKFDEGGFVGLPKPLNLQQTQRPIVLRPQNVIDFELEKARAENARRFTSYTPTQTYVSVSERPPSRTFLDDLKDEAEEAERYWRYPNQVARNIKRGAEGVGEVTKEILLPAAAMASIGGMQSSVLALSQSVNPITSQALGLLNVPKIQWSLMGMGALTGFGADMQYFKAGGKALGDALNVEKEGARTALNFISPGLFIGAYPSTTAAARSSSKKFSNTLLSDLFSTKKLQKRKYAAYESNRSLSDLYDDAKSLQYESLERAKNRLMKSPLGQSLALRKSNIRTARKRGNVNIVDLENRVSGYEVVDGKIRETAYNNIPVAKIFKTGQYQIADLTSGRLLAMENRLPSYGVKEFQVVNKSIGFGLHGQPTGINIDPEYSKIVKKNIELIETKIPGAKVFGSARLAADGDSPHFLGDYDIIISQKNYDRYVKDKYPLNPSSNKVNATEHVIFENAGEQGIMDFVVINENSNGLAKGPRALEIYKQFFPDEFFEMQKKLIKSNDFFPDINSISIPLTPDELLQKINPTVKSVVDMYETTSRKNVGKIDALINYANPATIIEGQTQFTKSLLGSKGRLAHLFEREQFLDSNKNLSLLKKINFLGDKIFVSKSPERMQAVLNDFYINRTIYGRGVSAEPDISLLEAAFKYWRPTKGLSKGGVAHGGGLNVVRLGDSGHGPVYGYIQRNYPARTTNPETYVDDIIKASNGSEFFNDDMLKIVNEILDKYHIPANRPADNLNAVIDIVEDLPNAEYALAEISKKTGVRTVLKEWDSYGKSQFASFLDDFDELTDVLSYHLRIEDQSGKGIKPPQSVLSREQKMLELSNDRIFDINTLEDFYKVRNFLEGGLEKARARTKEALDELASLYELENKRARTLDKKTQEFWEAKMKYYLEEINHYTKLGEQLEKRLDRAYDLTLSLYEYAIAGGGAYLITKGFRDMNQGFKERIEESKKGREKFIQFRSLDGPYGAINRVAIKNLGGDLDSLRAKVTGRRFSSTVYNKLVSDEAKKVFKTWEEQERDKRSSQLLREP